ncbi:GroEL supressor protein SugE [Weissella oryzae SG25]|uniref:GroEL supressor protein SugE n=1 Tax=Weissella oryzae (strain DSM 25784 / JCM 18191 / LMG 30913 / SG25) TaxID=1329250 RepID=A0A069D1A6_WEIOS|nr:multidrug efflux SMR transporter [Weissella oryzae]GAK31141.1 GroEL supressor protein SugE [Weissella oryzae SG25]
MTWLYLILAGLFEVFWSITMKLSQGFTELRFASLTVLGLITSFGFLALALKSMPLGMAYPIWTGIGAVGSILAGLLIFHESINGLTWFFIILLVIALIGIKISSQH